MTISTVSESATNVQTIASLLHGRGKHKDSDKNHEKLALHWCDITNTSQSALDEQITLVLLMTSTKRKNQTASESKMYGPS